jgi:hypothetical protein
MGHSQVRTKRPDGTGTRYLGTLGHVSGLMTSWTIPGGCEAASWMLGTDPRSRSDAMDPGRLVEVLRGGDVVWDGMLVEPQQADGGWSMAANGSGTFGSLFNADYGVGNSWATLAPDTVISNAIGRGLNWLPSAVHGTAGLFFGQAPDSGSIKIDAMLNQMTAPGGLTWWIRRTPAGNLLEMFDIAEVPNRLLISTMPAPRTLGGDINAIEIRYNSVPDLGQGYPAKYAVTYATDADSIAKHGRMEDYLDLSSNGAMLQTDAQAIGTQVLRRYKRASYAGPFQVRQGELLNLGGQPVDLGCFYQGNDGPMVCRLMLMDQGWGGEVAVGAPVFMAGRYEFSDDDDAAAITPFQTMSEDFGSMLQAAGQSARGRKVEVWRGSGALLWWFRGSGHPHERWKGNRHVVRGHGPVR